MITRLGKLMNTLVACCFGLGVVASPASAIDLSNNMSATMGGFESGGADRWLASSFATDSAPHALSSITLRIANPVPGQASVMLYSTAGLEPGSLVATLTSPGVYSTTLAPALFTASGVQLTPNTTYWVVFRALTGQFDWAWAADGSGTGTGFQRTWAVSEDGGTFWWSQDSYPVQMAVAVDTCTSPGVVLGPAEVSLCPGGTSVLSVSASGSSPSYRWRKGDVDLTDGGHFSGTSTASLSISSASAADAGSYSVTISNDCGSLTTGPATVTFCPADFNCSGLPNPVSVQDVFDYLNAYFNSDSRADINGLDGITVQDLFDFLGVYFNGC